MFNPKFNLTTAINELPSSLKKSVLFSLVGALNTRTFNTADRAVISLMKDGIELEDLRELDTQQIVRLFDGTDDTSTYHEAVVVASLAQEWREWLQKVAANPDVGLMAGTIDMMVGKQKPRASSAKGQVTLAHLGITRTPEERKATLMARLEQDQTRADTRARRVGFVEFIIDRVLTPATDGETEHYAEVSDELKEQLCNKFTQALQKAKQIAIENVELDNTWGDNLGAMEIVYLNSRFEDLVKEMYPAPVVDTSLPGPTAYRVIKPKAEPVQQEPATIG